MNAPFGLAKRLTGLLSYRFLLAKIHLELLSKYTDRSLLERALHHLPQSLNEAYGEAMKQVLSTNPRAKRHVYWTLYAFRPLSVAELQDATKTAEPEDRQEEMTFEQHLQIQTAGFLTVDAVTGTVRFIHKTVKEYLEGAVARVFFPDAKKDIAEACLTAIASDEAIDDCYVSNRTSRNRSNGFLSYAATYWGYHAREVPEEEQTIQVLIKAFLNKLQWRRPPQDCVETKEMPSELGLGKYPEDWSALHILAFFGIRSKSKRLLEQGAKANTNDNSLKATPLHCAAARGNDEMVEFLLDSGVNSNAVANDGSTALHMATQHGHRKAMKLLLCQPVNAQISNHKGSRSLHLAVETAACEATVPLLVKHKAGVDSRNPRTGDTALHLAVEWRRPRVILFLLEQGAAVDMSNEDGLTPLQLAVKTDNCEAISILLQRGAHVDARSFSGLTALQIAAQRKHWIAFDLLVIGGANLDTWNHNGETLLHEQARNSFSSTSIAAKLLKQGANIEARSPQGYTALQYAAMSGNKMMFMHLLSQGAKIDVLTPKGESLLHITPPLNNDCLDILRPLLNRNLKTNIVSSEGWMPLHKIVYMGTGAMDLESDKTREFIELLLSHGADINAYTTTAIAETPLHLATRASPCRPQLISFLVGLGADINALTNEGKTPLHLAGERGRESIFRILLGAGADFYLEIPDTMSPIPETQKTTPMEESATSAGSTAFDLARKNPFSVLWLDDEGKLCPAPERKRRDSVGTVIEEELEPEDLDDDMTESTLVGSERQLVLV